MYGQCTGRWRCRCQRLRSRSDLSFPPEGMSWGRAGSVEQPCSVILKKAVKRLLVLKAWGRPASP